MAGQTPPEAGRRLGLLVGWPGRACPGRSLEARRDVSRGDSGSRGVDWQEQREGSVHQFQQATGRMAVIEQAGRSRRQDPRH